jgi:hypothetical protein
VDKLFRDLPPFDSTSSSGKVVGDVDVAIETHLQTLQVNELLHHSFLFPPDRTCL